MLLSSTFFPVPSVYVAEVAERATSGALFTSTMFSRFVALACAPWSSVTVNVMARCSIRGVDDGFKNVVVRSTA